MKNADLSIINFTVELLFQFEFLKPIQKDIISYYLIEHKNFEEISSILDLSTERIRQIYNESSKIVEQNISETLEIVKKYNSEISTLLSENFQLSIENQDLRDKLNLLNQINDLPFNNKLFTQLISKTDLSFRIKEIFKIYDIKFIYEMVYLYPILSKFRNMGAISLKEIKAFIKSNNLILSSTEGKFLFYKLQEKFSNDDLIIKWLLQIKIKKRY